MVTKKEGGREGGYKSIGRDQFLPALTIQDMNIHTANSIGGITRQRQYTGADVFIS
jgi:hypothetical protein